MAGGRKYVLAGLFLAALLAAAAAAGAAAGAAAKEPAAAKASPTKSPQAKAPPAKPPQEKPATKAPEPKAVHAEPVVKAAATKSELGSKKILVLLPVAAPSHHNVFSSILYQLLERGHYVTIVSGRPQKTKHPRLREILFTDPFEEFMKKTPVDLMGKPMWSFQKVIMMYFLGGVLNEAVLKNPDALALKKESFDLVVVETYFYQEALLGFAHHFGCPAVTINPFGYSPEMNEFTGGNINPAYVPNIFGGGTSPETFLERLDNTVNTVFAMLANHLYWFPKMNALMHEVFPDAPHINDLMKNVSLTLINNHPALMVSVALAPSVIEIGGVHIKPGKPLPADLKKWIEDSKDGIVYFSLGSNIKPGMLPPDRRDAIFRSFAKLKQRVLVKWNAELPPNPPANCRFEDWVPQQEVLAHPNLKVFVTHGGLLSTQESVYFGAAIVGMPVFGDQEMNMRLAVQKGFGQMVSFFNLKTEELDAALAEVINNPKYRKESQKMSVRFRSDPISSLDKAMHYLELLLKLGDLRHLQPSSVHLRWYEYMLLDVIGVLALGLYLSWRIVRCICGIICGCCSKSSKAKKD